MSKEEYSKYLLSDHWKQLKETKKRKYLLKHKKIACAICGSTTEKIDLHHMTYRNLYDVKITDLRFLCRTCHFTFHELKDRGKIKFKKDASHHSKFAVTKNKVMIARGLYVLRSKRKRKNIIKSNILTGKQPGLFEDNKPLTIKEMLWKDV